MAYAARNGKQLTISVIMGYAAPNWVYAAGVPSITLTQPANGTRMPVLWNTIMLSKSKRFIGALAAHIAANPNKQVVKAIVMGGLGQTIESYIARDANERRQWEAAGGLNGWYSGVKSVIDMHALAFPTIPFIFTAAKPYGPTLPSSISKLEQIISYGVNTYPGRFGIMNASLGAASADYLTDPNLYGYWPNMAVHDNSNTSPVGLQFLCSSLGNGSQTLGGTLAQALDAGVNLKAHYLELYPVDADEPNNFTLLRNTEVRLP